MRIGGWKIPLLRLKCRAWGYCSISKAKEKKKGGGDLSEQPVALFELHIALMRASIRIQALEVQTWDFNISSLNFSPLLLWKCLIFESFSRDVLLKMNKYKERKQTFSLSTLRPGCSDREGEADLQCHRRLHGPHRRLPAGEAVRGQRRRQQVQKSAMKTWLPVCFVPQGSQFSFPCVCRAIIIRNNDIIPMSTEFTPESERQRLQFLVKNEYEKERHRPDLRKSADKRRVLQGPYRLSQGLSFSAAQSGNWIKQSAKDEKLRLLFIWPVTVSYVLSLLHFLCVS